MDPKLIQSALDALVAGDAEACAEILKNMIAAAAGAAVGAPPAGEALAENAETPPDPEKEEMAALSRELVALSGRPAGESAAYFRGLHEASVATAADRVRLEAGERRGLVAELVKLGVELPALAWRDVTAEGDKREPVKRLADEPIAEMRTRVSAIKASRGGAREIAPPVVPVVLVKLSKAEQDYCTKHNMTPEQFKARKDSMVVRNK